MKMARQNTTEPDIQFHKYIIVLVLSDPPTKQPNELSFQVPALPILYASRNATESLRSAEPCCVSISEIHSSAYLQYSSNNLTFFHLCRPPQISDPSSRPI